MALLEQYTRINDVAGISILLQPDGSFRISACRVTAQGSQLDISKKLLQVSSFEELQKQLPAGLPVALNLSGKGVLTKQVARLDTVTAAELASLLPNSKPEDFYVQHFASDGQSFVSFIRKAEAGKWIIRMNELGFSPLCLSLGPFAIVHIVPQLNEYAEELIVDGYRIKRDEEGNWQSYRYEPELKSSFPVKLAGEKIDERLLLPYAAAFQLILSARLQSIRAEVPDLTAALHQKLALQQLKAKGFVMLIVFFVLLLVNFGLLSYYTSANNRLSGQVSLSARTSTDYEQLSQKIRRGEGLLHDLGWEKGPSKSNLIDQLAQCLPEGVYWQEVAFNPPEQLAGQGRQHFQNRVIRIRGNSAQVIPVNEWLARIKLKRWVRQAQLEDYTYNAEAATGQFTLIIHY